MNISPEKLAEHARKKILAKAAETQALVVLALDAALKAHTPRDSGRAAAGWNVAKGAPVGGDPGPGNHTPRPISLSEAKAVSDGETSVYNANAVPYIRVLDKGLYPPEESEKTIHHFSRQAPDGIVRPAVDEVMRVVR